MPLLFRGVSASEYGSLLVPALEAAIETRDAVTILDPPMDGNPSRDERERQYYLDAFSDAYEISQVQVMRLQALYRQLDNNKPAGRLPRALHGFASRYIDAIARRTDAANNLLWSQSKGNQKDVKKYQKVIGAYNYAVHNQARLLADCIDEALFDDPKTAAQLLLSRELAAQIRASADAPWALSEVPT